MRHSSHRSFEIDSADQISARRYTELIECCYKLHPDSAPYWKRLISYIAPCIQGQTSILQEPKYFNFAKRLISSSAALHFPFTVAGGEQHTESPRVILLEGFPSPHCVASLGAQFELRPELFIGHLELARHQGDSDFDIANGQNGVVHFRSTTLVKPWSASPTSLVKQRADAEKAYVQLQEGLFNEKRYGESRFREIHLHTSSFFSIEQTVSFAVSRRADNKWDGESFLCYNYPITKSSIAIFLTDHGRTIDSRSLPWLKFWKGKVQGSRPVVPYGASADVLTSCDETFYSALDQLHPLKHVLVADDVDLELLHTDPFFLFSGTMGVCAATWAQLLSFLETTTKDFQNFETDRLSFTLKQLQYTMNLVSRVDGLCSEYLTFVQQGGCTSWPKAATPETVQRKATLQSQLVSEYSSLKKRCDRIARSCELASNMLVSFAQLKDAEKGIEQTRQVHRLSQLAFAFLPLSFASSVFGMNVKELDPAPSVWKFILVGILLACVSMLLAIWDTAFGPGSQGGILWDITVSKFKQIT